MYFRVRLTLAFAQRADDVLVYTRKGESSVVKEVLHRDHPGIIGKQRYTIGCTLFGACISQGRHFVSVIKEPVESFDAGSGRGDGGGLGNRIHPNLLQFAKVIAEASGNGLQ